LEYWGTEAGRNGLRDYAEGSARALNPTREARVLPDTRAKEREVRAGLL